MRAELRNLGKELVWLLSDFGIGYAEKLLAKVPPVLERCYAVRDVLDAQVGRWQLWVDEEKARWLDSSMSESSLTMIAAAELGRAGQPPFDAMQHVPSARARVAQRRGRG